MRQFWIGTLAVAILAVSCPVTGWAADGGSAALQISPNNTDSTMQTQGQEPYNTDNMPLRGHVTTIPKGTMMMVKLDQPLNSASSKVGDPVSAVVEADVYLDNQIGVPAGSRVEGSVTSVSPAAHLGKPGSLELQFYNVKTSYGYVIPIRAHLVTDDSTGVIRGDSAQAQVLKTLGTAAGGTAAGTLMGTAAGGLLGAAGSGAVFGLAAGSLVGVGYAITREGKQVVIPSGARMSIIMDQPVAVN